MGRVFFFTLLLFNFSTSPVKAELVHFNGNTSAIYGQDDGTFVDTNSSLKINELSKSIAMITSKDIVEKRLFNSIIEGNLLSDREGLNLCADEKFSDHHSVNSCTGFLIAEDLLASAGHCFSSDLDCSNKVIVFDVFQKNEVKKGYRISNKNIYECKEVVSRVLDSENSIDYVVIRLKRKVADRPILKLRTAGLISSNEKVFMIGHPLGLPLVVSTTANIVESDNDHFFKATLDSFEGNSGSPVFNSKTFEVEGILVRGEEDFFKDLSLQCSRDQVYGQKPEELTALKGEGVNRIGDILPLLTF